MSGVQNRLTEGLATHVRSDGSVIRLHAGGRLIGEIVIGDGGTTRVNFKDAFTPDVDLVAEAEGISISGRSKSWAGGLRVTDENVGAVKQVLSAIAEEAVETEQIERDVRNSLLALERAASVGILDKFEEDLKGLLERRSSPPMRRRRGRRGRSSRSAVMTG